MVLVVNMRMKRLFQALLVLLCTSRTVTAEPSVMHYYKTDFNELRVGDGLSVEVQQSDHYAVTGYGRASDLAKLNVVQVGNKLQVDLHDQIQHKLVIQVSLPEIKRIVAYDASSVILGPGQSEEIKIIAKSASDINAYEWAFREVSVDISEASSVSVRALNSLKGAVRTASSLSYLAMGRPFTFDVHTSIASSVSEIGI